MGISTIFSLFFAALINISDANSIPGDKAFIFSHAFLVIALIPQFVSDILVPNSMFVVRVRSGFPTYLCSLGIAPGKILPLSLVPIAMSTSLFFSIFMNLDISWRSYVPSASAIIIYFPLASENPV